MRYCYSILEEGVVLHSVHSVDTSHSANSILYRFRNNNSTKCSLNDDEYIGKRNIYELDFIECKSHTSGSAQYLWNKKIIALVFIYVLSRCEINKFINCSYSCHIH